MDLVSLEAFVRSAESGSFSSAARKLAVTPAAVSKSVAKLEDSLGVRLFQRTTRKITLTEAGEHFLSDASKGLTTLQEAFERTTGQRQEPSGTLKVSVAPGFGRQYVLPVLTPYLARCPKVTPEWHFENRQVDLIAEGYDVAVGVGLELSAGLVARELAHIHIVAVSSKAYVKKHGAPKHPDELAEHQIIAFRSSRTGKRRAWSMQNKKGQELVVDPPARVLLSDVEAMESMVASGAGIALIPTSQVLDKLERGNLVRVVPDWHADGGPLFVYFSSARLLPMRTRVFVDMLVEHFKREKLIERFRAD
ncbi:MAG: LysR family transcriptional regulator [Archangium sp.]|nr:LysR family transcriptional regulator [Archangium sp.]